MLSPKIEGRILQALAIKKTDRVLEIGTGTGYLTALMGLQAKHVDSLELNSKLSAAAAKRIAAQKIKNVSLKVADGLAANEASYDVIVLTGSLPVYPVEIEHQLAIGGRMFVVVGDAPAMEAILVTRVSADAVRRDNLFETCLPALANAPQPSRFSF
jgi:protein-L-isoaspartate(D-aspartate) O-methyltransferase